MSKPITIFLLLWLTFTTLSGVGLYRYYNPPPTDFSVLPTYTIDVVMEFASDTRDVYITFDEYGNMVEVTREEFYGD